MGKLELVFFLIEELSIILLFSLSVVIILIRINPLTKLVFDLRKKEWKSIWAGEGSALMWGGSRKIAPTCIKRKKSCSAKKVKNLTDDVTGSERCEIFLHNISPSEAAAAFALAFLCIWCRHRTFCTFAHTSLALIKGTCSRLSDKILIVKQADVCSLQVIFLARDILSKYWLINKLTVCLLTDKTFNSFLGAIVKWKVMINIMILSGMGYMGSIYFMDIVIHFPVLGNEQNLFSMLASSMSFVSSKPAETLSKQKSAWKERILSIFWARNPLDCYTTRATAVLKTIKSVEGVVWRELTCFLEKSHVYLWSDTWKAISLITIRYKMGWESLLVIQTIQ